MNLSWPVTAAILFVLSGAVLLGQGITGMMVAESCCFPPNCSPERLCDVVSAQTESPSQVPGAGLHLIGGALLLVGALLVLKIHKKK